MRWFEKEMWRGGGVIKDMVILSSEGNVWKEVKQCMDSVKKRYAKGNGVKKRRNYVARKRYVNDIFWNSEENMWRKVRISRILWKKAQKKRR